MLRNRRAEIEELAGIANDNADAIAAEMSAAQLARLFDMSHRQINTLAEKGILGRNAEGKFDTTDSIRRYITYCRKGGNSELESEKLPVLQMAHLSSAQGVQIQRTEAWDTLGMRFRAFLDFGCGWSDWRGAYKNPGV